jgi:hypothetical protein
MATASTIPKSELVQGSGQFSTFFVADLFFGVDVLNVQEVLRFQQMTPVSSHGSCDAGHLVTSR